MKDKFFILTVFVLSQLSISYAESILENGKCKNSFTSLTPLHKNRYKILDYYKKFLPIDHKLQETILKRQERIIFNKGFEHVMYTLEVKVYDKENINFLIEKISSDPELLKFKNEEGQNLLHLAVIYNNLKLAKFLIESSIQLINEQDKQGVSPLLFSITRSNDLDIFKFLIKHPFIHTSVKDNFNQNIFHYIFLAIQKHRKELIDIVSENLDSSTISSMLNSGNQLEETPLNYFIRSFDTEIANQLLKIATIDFSQKEIKGNTLLHVASFIPDRNAIDFLVKHSNNIDQKNEDGRTPIQVFKLYNPLASERIIQNLFF